MNAILSLLLLSAVQAPTATLKPSEWLARPAPTDHDACLPPVTDVGFGQVTLNCRVRPDGSLVDCHADGDNRWLREQALCMAPKFRAPRQRAGQRIRIPITSKPAD